MYPQATADLSLAEGVPRVVIFHGFEEMRFRCGARMCARRNSNLYQISEISGIELPNLSVYPSDRSLLGFGLGWGGAIGVAQVWLK